MAKTTTKTQSPAAAVTNIQIQDPERRAKIVAVFAARGMGELPGSMMLRLLIDEWLAAQKPTA